MIQKVIILEIGEKYALALNQEGVVLRIQLKSEMKKGDKIFVLDEDLYEEQQAAPTLITTARKASGSKNSMMRILGAAAAFILVLAAILIPFTTQTAYATVSIDGQQRLELLIDGDTRILKANLIQSDGKRVEIKDFNGKQLAEAEADIMVLTGSEDKQLIIGYALDDDAKSDSESLHRWLTDVKENAALMILRGEKADLAAAKAEQKSLGTYLTEKLIREDRLEEVLDEMSVEELIQHLLNHPDLKDNSGALQILKEKLDEITRQPIHKPTKSPTMPVKPPVSKPAPIVTPNDDDDNGSTNVPSEQPIYGDDDDDDWDDDDDDEYDDDDDYDGEWDDDDEYDDD
ncbi:MAG: hypothetical protein Q4G61_10780 [Tissierellia bacterium]|nr:hypothetical protein [Tissierellia bacterium]